jgi:predicted metal-dependent phosphotriesterase family hydrolase
MLFGMDVTSYLIFSGIGYLIYLVIAQRKAQEYDIPPLDIIDGKKLDEMVAKQVKSSLIPLLQAQGYQEEQIKQILNRNSTN